MLAVLNTTTHRLSKQRKTDFRLRDDDQTLTNLQTEVLSFLFKRQLTIAMPECNILLE